jgi:polysaccharide export outer membrane protein
MSLRIQFAVLATLVALLPGCAHNAPFVWVESLSPAQGEATSDYVIAPGDLVSIQVWEQEKMLTRARVRDDGKISLPLLHDVAIGGKTPDAAAIELEAALKPYMLTPKVNVVVEERKPITVSALGQVSKPGQYVMDRGAGVAQVLAAAGGLTAFAHKDRIFVLRETAQKQQRVRFTFESLTGSSGPAMKFRVQSGDVVVVE